MDVVTYTQLTPAIHLQLPESLESSMIHSVDSGFGGSDHQEQQVAISETDIGNLKPENINSISKRWFPI